MNVIRIATAAVTLPLLMANSSAPVAESKPIFTKAATVMPAISKKSDCYASWNLTAAGLSKEAFECAVKGYERLQQKNLLKKTTVLTIVDYSLPSTQKRLYVLDMAGGKILFHSLAAHGRNSGLLYASDFSNTPSSLKTSLGFFVTAGTYYGGNGYSLKLKGCEKGINDNAMERAIVMHGAPYVNEQFIQQNGYLGRSHGCPALPENISKKLIDIIKDGSCVFLYHPEKKYTAHSKILNSGA
jgi:L,D-transpeptidase catalytic domain